MKEYTELLKKLNLKAKSKGDIPVSALIIKDNKIISKGSNNKYDKCNPLGHAEINAIISACKKLKRTNLIDCTLLVTLKPCKMCVGLINEVRIKKVYYILDNFKEINENIQFTKLDDENNYFQNELVEFFRDKR